MATKRYNLGLAAMIAGLGLVGWSAGPAAAEPAPDRPATQPAAGQENGQAAQLRAQLLKAYHDAPGYQGHVFYEIEMSQAQGRIKATQAMDYKVAFDRASGRLTIDQPDMLMVSDGNRLKLKAAQIADRYLDTEAPKLTDYTSIHEAVPVLPVGLLPDLALLLGDDLGSAQAEYLAPEAGDAAHAPGLRFKTDDGGTMTLRVDPETHLLRSVRIDAAPAPADQPAAPTVWKTYRFETRPILGPVDAKAFTFDVPANAKSYATIRDMVAGQGQDAGQGGGDAPEKAALEGQAPPPVALNTIDGKPFKLTDEKAKVVILDFWATWCGPCRQSLPHLQAVADWAKKGNKSLAIYTINLQETPEQARKFWTDQNFTMPVLMDTDGGVGRAYGIEAIPQTIIIANGKILHVHVGLAPDMEDTLKKEIDQLQAPAVPEAQDSGQPPRNTLK